MAFMRVVLARSLHAHERSPRVPVRAAIEYARRTGGRGRQLAALPVLQGNGWRLLVPVLALHADPQAGAASGAEAHIEDGVLALEDSPAPHLAELLRDTGEV